MSTPNLSSPMLSTAEMADLLGITPRRVRALASKRGIGTRLGRRSLAFTTQDLRVLQKRPQQPAV